MAISVQSLCNIKVWVLIVDKIKMVIGLPTVKPYVIHDFYKMNKLDVMKLLSEKNNIKILFYNILHYFLYYQT